MRYYILEIYNNDVISYVIIFYIITYLVNIVLKR